MQPLDRELFSLILSRVLVEVVRLAPLPTVRGSQTSPASGAVVITYQTDCEGKPRSIQEGQFEKAWDGKAQKIERQWEARRHVLGEEGWPSYACHAPAMCWAWPGCWCLLPVFAGESVWVDDGLDPESPLESLGAADAQTKMLHFASSPLQLSMPRRVRGGCPFHVWVPFASAMGCAEVYEDSRPLLTPWHIPVHTADGLIINHGFSKRG